jgi:uncharacterized cofD-like protein
MRNIVTIGGGTGSYTVLSGLKHIENVSLTALVSMSDDGGSTGVLRDELGVLPPGDVRQCLVALSEHSDVVRKLMSYRFTEGTLSGHSFGNIFLAALEKVTGDFVEGVEIASEILKVEGKVVPITRSQAELSICLKDDSCIKGESTINHTDLQTIGIDTIEYTDAVDINPHATQALLEADMIILGPGNYYCSVIPNLIVSGCKEALQKTKAKIVFPINLTNKQGHTLGWGVQQYVHDIETYLGRRVDTILVNSEPPTEEQIKKYKMEEGDGVLVVDDMGDDARVMRAGLLSHVLIEVQEKDKHIRGFIRHDKDKLKDAIVQLL